MSTSKRWVVVSSLALGVVLSCAEAEDPNADTDPGDEAGSSGNGGAATNTGGKSTAGSTAGGKSGGSGGMAGAGGKAGAGGTSNHAGTATEGGRAGTAPVEEGGADSGGSGGSSGSGPMALGCIVEAAGGMPAAEGGMANAGGAGEVTAGGPSASGGADSGAGGAPAGPLSLFFDDFEGGQAARWTPTGGTWAVVADATQAYEQSLLENKLQISIANDTCFADQIIETRVKVTEFKGQSNSYVAALFGRALSASTHYLLALGSDKKLILRKRVSSTSTSATAIGTAVAFTTTPDQWYDVRFEIIGTSLKGCVGAVCVTGTDSSITSGGVGVGTVNTSARFDDVRVTSP